MLNISAEIESNFFLNIDIKKYCNLAIPLYGLIYTLEQTVNIVWLTLYVKTRKVQLNIT